MLKSKKGGWFSRSGRERKQLVLDARTGMPISLNCEATRLMDDRRMSDKSDENLIGEMTIRRAVGPALRGVPLRTEFVPCRVAPVDR